ncbi:MAG: hypothetical protein NC548_06485 [Lachnospiraceae bacterium]|nr:hypothetical protein [Lachnospiraceae bacterium]
MLTKDEFWSKIKVVEETPMCWPVYEVMHQTIGAIYMLAPRHQPRKVEYIIPKLLAKLENHEKVESSGADGTEKFYFFTISLKDLKNLLRDVLMSISEYRELNLTQIEYENEVNPDDESRSGFVFTSRYDVYPEDHWKEEFIDLEACVQNIYCGLRDAKVVDMCFDSPESIRTRINHKMWDLKCKWFGPLMDKHAEKEANKKEEAAKKTAMNESSNDDNSSKLAVSPEVVKKVDAVLGKSAESIGQMTLREFIGHYVCKNTLIHLWKFVSKYDGTVGSMKQLLVNHEPQGENDESFSDVGMEWQILDGSGWQAKYADCLVIGITDIITEHDREAINIIINPIGVDDE